MVPSSHSNRKPVVWCRSKLDTVLEFAPLFSPRHAIYVTVVEVFKAAVDIKSTSVEVGIHPYNTAGVTSLTGPCIFSNIN